MTLADQGFLDFGAMRLEYRMIGARPDAAATLVLLHEGLGSVAVWGDFPERLAAATKALAREDCRTLAVFGAGRLALPSIELVSHVRPIDRLFVVGRSRARIDALAL